MTHVTRFVVVAAAELPALALCVPVQAQTPEIDALRVRAEAGDAEARYNLASGTTSVRVCRRTAPKRCGGGLR